MTIANMKPAVFQVDQGDGVVRLICIHVATLRDALELENAIRRKLPPNWHASFIGRFDSIEVAAGPSELVASIFGTELTIVNL